MELNAEQQALAAEAAKLVPVCLKVFLRQLPCLRAIAQVSDLESAAYVACCKAARTYDPTRGVGISAYFSVAIRNAMLREVQREIKSRAHSIERISLDEAARRQPPKRVAPEAALPAMLQLTEEERDWIESWVFDGASFRSFGRQADCDPRTAKKLLKSRLAKLKDLVDDQP